MQATISTTGKPVVVSLFDYTGAAVRPWADAGHDCLCFDLQHDRESQDTGMHRVERVVGGGSITYLRWDSDAYNAGWRVTLAVNGRKVAMVYGFPPCTDLASSGARHWATKRKVDPRFQARAVARAKLCEAIARSLAAPFAIENPAGALSTLWRKADHSFNPCDFGQYIAPAEAEHPLWPDYIPARDAYTKRTMLWTGNGFRMPPKLPVAPDTVTLANGKQGSRQWAKLGGKSMRTKNIRSATPRGFAIAAFLANRPVESPHFNIAGALSRSGLSLS